MTIEKSNKKTAKPKQKLLIATTVPVTLRAFLLPYADHFRARGWVVDAMAKDASSYEPISGHFDNVFDVAWGRNPLSPGNFSCMKDVVRIAQEGEYDIVHVHTPVAAFVTRTALRNLHAQGRTKNSKVVYTAHGFHFYNGAPWQRNLLYRSIERLAGKWTDRLIVINREDFEAAKKYRIVPEDSLMYMPGIGLDFSKYSRDSVSRDEILAVKTELGLKDEDVLYTTIAEFNPGKRLKDVIIALAKTKNPHIHVAFAGDGPLKQKMQDLARAYSIHQRIHFMGHLKNLNPLIVASRATIMPSGREGLSRSLMESACLGVPMIGTDARGVRDVIEPRRGLLYPTGDVLALRDMMLRMFEEPYPQVEPDPAWKIENLIGLHEKLYAELLEENVVKEEKEEKKENDGDE